MSDQPVEGAPFRRNYIRPDKKLSDSIRARRRIYQIAVGFTDTPRYDFVNLVENELGVPFPGYGGHDHEKFWTESEVPDFLSAITFLYHVSRTQPKTLSELRRVISEEHLHYRVDDRGGVHYQVDEQFERNIHAAIEGLGSQKYDAARHALEQAVNAMNGPSPSGKTLIRGVFEAVESAFLVRIQPAPTNVNILNEPNVVKYLRPILETRYAGVPEASDKLDRVLEIHKSWVRAAHPFRHGVPFDQIHEAPLDYAVLLADQGMAFLRYIVAP
jgi:hypothetical protein